MHNLTFRVSADTHFTSPPLPTLQFDPVARTHDQHGLGLLAELGPHAPQLSSESGKSVLRCVL